MSTLISCHDLAKSYWDRTLFEGVSLHVRPEERLGIIGANGSGKSTLLRILAGQDEPDEGDVQLRRDLRVAFVEQDPTLDADLTVVESVEAALSAALRSPLEGETDAHVRVSRTLSEVGLSEPGRRVGELSGGWRKRVSIARALVVDPELLLLDEPTNHLDLEGVVWLEKRLAAARFAFVVVTHDRAFLQAAATRVAQLDRRFPGGCFTAVGTYRDFLEKREALLEGLARREESLRAKVRREVEWLARGPKARTTKARGRIDAARRLTEELEELQSRAKGGTAGIDFVASGRKTRRLLVGRGIHKALGGRTLLDGLDILLRPGMRLGLVGDNGSGKTTLLKLLAGDLDPDEGRIDRVAGLETVYFDQQREQLDPELTVRKTLVGKGDTVHFRGRPIHVASWAKRFLFGSEMLDMKVGRLSGGEQARLVVARLMLRPADVLLLDEPTNDLDIPTLEVLEESLADFPGALVMVTHDRYFLDSVTTVLLGLDGQGGATPFADYAQWAESRRPSPGRGDGARKGKERRRGRGAAAPKLTWAEQREYEGMEEAILAAETALGEAEQRAGDPDVVSDAEALQERCAALEEAQRQVEELYARWETLDAKHRVWEAGK